jgi:predicted phage terminase large subunit-like protein
MPPRHGKSELVSAHYPAWVLGRWPDRKVGLASYQADFAASWGQRCRDTLSEFGPDLFGVGVARQYAARDDWKTCDREGRLQGGGMMTAGVGGALTGKGFDDFIIDDPVENDEQADSPRHRQKAKNWYRATAHTRLEPGGAIVAVSTRWNEDDLMGWLISEGWSGEEFVHVNLPAIAEADDPLGREPGEALWPERYDINALNKLREVLGAYWFGSLFQGRPTPLEGGMFRAQDFRNFTIERDGTNAVYVLNLPSGGTKRWKDSECKHHCALDVAVSTKQSADYTVAALFAITPHNETLVVDVWRDRVEGPDIVPIVANLHAQWVPGFWVIERVAAQLTFVQEARRRGLPVVEGVADRDKETRAVPVGRRMRDGFIYFRQGARWRPQWDEELSQFPNGAHDDQADVLSYGDSYRAGGSRTRVRVL